MNLILTVNKGNKILLKIKLNKIKLNHNNVN